MGALVLSLLAVHCYLTTIKYSLGKPISVCLHNNKLLAFSVQLLNFFQHCNFVLLSSVQYKVTVEALVQYKYIIITSLYIFKSQSTSSCTIQIFYKLLYNSNLLQACSCIHVQFKSKPLYHSNSLPDHKVIHFWLELVGIIPVQCYSCGSLSAFLFTLKASCVVFQQQLLTFTVPPQ